MERLKTSTGTSENMYGGMANFVIHPGTYIDVTTVTVIINRKELQAKDLIINYKIAAEDARLIEDQKIIPGSQLLDIVKENV